MKVLLVTLFVFSVALIPVISAHAETFLTLEEAKQEIWQGEVLTPFNVTLTKEQQELGTKIL
jgi:hypothetical protein